MARKNKEETREYNKRYWREHRDELIAKRNAATTTEERTAYHNEWQRKNREKYNAYLKAWRAKKKAEKESAIGKNEKV